MHRILIELPLQRKKLRNSMDLRSFKFWGEVLEIQLARNLNTSCETCYARSYLAESRGIEHCIRKPE